MEEEERVFEDACLGINNVDNLLVETCLRPSLLSIGKTSMETVYY